MDPLGKPSCLEGLWLEYLVPTFRSSTNNRGISSILFGFAWFGLV